MKIVDARGVDCPKPVIMTKNQLDSMEEGTTKTLADNEVCVNNLRKFAQGQGYAIEIEEKKEEGLWEVLITKRVQDPEAGHEEASSNPDQGFFLLVTGDKLGQDETLGRVLIKSFLYTVSQTKPYPRTLAFLNSGVHLTCQGSEVLEDLKILEQAGVEIISCGICLEYFNSKDQLAVGEISNMYHIYEELAAASRSAVIG